MTPAPRHPSLTAPLDTACARVEAALPDALGRAAAALVRSAERSPPGYRHRRLTEAHGLVLAQRAASAGPFSRALRRDAASTCERGAAPGLRPPPATDWGSLTLVQDDEVERQVAADRMGLAMALRCEWEWRALEATLRSWLEGQGAMPRTLPLAPALIGRAMLEAMAGWPIEADLRPAIESAVADGWADALPGLYTAIGQDFARAGHLAPAHGGASAGMQADAARAGVNRGPRALPLRVPPMATAPHASALQRGHAAATGIAGEPSARMAAHAPVRGPLGDPQASPAADEDFTRLLRSWTQTAATGLAGRRAPEPPEGTASAGASRPTVGGGAPGGDAIQAAETGPWPNLIRVHGERLRAHARHALDHHVIDAVGALFEQILSDPAVPAPMAQQIARLQLPVLRAALADPSFFGRADHPVRRALDRLAALGVALDKLLPESAHALLARVRDAVQTIVDGDFAQLAVFAQTLDALERFVAEQGRDALRRHGADAEVLAEQEHLERRIMRLGTGLATAWAVHGWPDFLLRFTVGPWSRVIVCHATREGLDSAAARAAMTLARDLALSVVPRGDRERQRAFVSSLPRLMQGLTAGMDLIDWHATERHAFFDQLLPCHAATLRGEGRSALDLNLLAVRLDLELRQALAQAWTDDEAQAHGEPAAWTRHVQPQLPAGTARALGLLDDAPISSPPSPPPVTAIAPVTPEDLALPGLPVADTVEPVTGEALAARLEIGCAYQMHLPDGWHAVRLTHISPGGLFVVFVRGSRHQRLISLTQRMVLRMCREGRLRRLEAATLVERATARARSQLAQLRRGPALSPS